MTYRVTLKATKPTPPDDGIMFPPGFVKEQVTHILVYVEAEDELKAAKEGLKIYQTDYPSDWSVEVKTVEFVETPRPGFNQMDDTKTTKHTSGTQLKDIKTTGKLKED